MPSFAGGAGGFGTSRVRLPIITTHTMLACGKWAAIFEGLVRNPLPPLISATPPPAALSPVKLLQGTPRCSPTRKVPRRVSEALSTRRRDARGKTRRRPHLYTVSTHSPTSCLEKNLRNFLCFVHIYPYIPTTCVVRFFQMRTATTRSYKVAQAD